MTSPNQHGGERPGAGRKRVDTVEHRVRLPVWTISLLTALGDGRLSKGIVRAADALRIGNEKSAEA